MEFHIIHLSDAIALHFYTFIQKYDIYSIFVVKIRLYIVILPLNWVTDVI